MTKPTKTAPNADLIAEISALRAEVATLNGHRFIQLHNSMFKLAGLQFMRGLAFGLGSVFGATLLVSILVYTLSNIDFIPIIGQYAKEIADMIGAPVQ